MSTRCLCSLYLRKSYWYWSYYRGGRRIRVSAGSRDRAEADRFRAHRLRELAPVPASLRLRPLAVGDPLDVLTAEQCKSRTRWAPNYWSKCAALRHALGEVLAGELSLEDVRCFQAARAGRSQRPAKSVASESPEAWRKVVSRVARRFPQVLDAVAEGRLSAEALRRLAPRLQADNVDRLLSEEATASPGKGRWPDCRNVV